MMPRVAALATPSTAHWRAWDGASPGTQVSPWGLVSGATCSSSLANWPACCSASSAAGPVLGRWASMPTASITRSGPLPPVSSRSTCAGSSALKSIVSAPWRRAASRREGSPSTARPRPLEQGAVDGELAHRAAAEHGHDVALADLGQPGPEPGRWEDVRQHDRLVIGDLVGQLDQADVGEGDAHQL